MKAASSGPSDAGSNPPAGGEAEWPLYFSCAASTEGVNASWQKAEFMGWPRRAHERREGFGRAATGLFPARLHQVRPILARLASFCLFSRSSERLNDSHPP